MHNNNNLDFKLLSNVEEEELKIKKEKEKEILKIKKNRYSSFFDNEVGIEFLVELLNKSGVLKKRALFYNSQNSVDITKICFADGYREMFLEILTLLNDNIINKVFNYNGK